MLKGAKGEYGELGDSQISPHGGAQIEMPRFVGAY
jgi:hypothetical protein